MHGKDRCARQGVCMAGEMVTAADVTQPTGMHSCLGLFLNCFPSPAGNNSL